MAQTHFSLIFKNTPFTNPVISTFLEPKIPLKDGFELDCKINKYWIKGEVIILYKITEGMEVTLTEKGRRYMGIDDSVLKIQTIIYDDYTSFEGKISTLDETRFVYVGRIEKEWFNYNSNSLIGEIYHLLDNHNIKSFQAILDDGRVINFSCLN